MKLSSTLFSGYVVQGSNGEYVYLSAEEKIEVIEFVKKEIPKDRLIIAGSGCEGNAPRIHASHHRLDGALGPHPTMYPPLVATPISLHRSDYLTMSLQWQVIKL